MANPKYHWAILVSDPSKHRHAWKAYAGGHYIQACGRKKKSAVGYSAERFAAKVQRNPDWYCSDCAKAARLALAKESAPKPASRCATSGCGSYAINPGQSGRDDTSDLDLCDVCYWRKQALATWPKPRPIEEYAGNDPFLGLCGHHGWLAVRPERSKSGNRLHGWLTCGPSAVYVVPTHFLPLPPEVK